jgi:hypothetical protein
MQKWGKQIFKMVLKARVDPRQVDYTEAGVILELIPDDPPGPPNLSLLHQHRHPGHDGSKAMIISKGQDPPKVTLTSSTDFWWCFEGL